MGRDHRGQGPALAQIRRRLQVKRSGRYHPNLMPSTLTHLECSICGERHDADRVQTVCTACGRALFARYDLDEARRTFTREALGTREWSMWRYQELMPVRDPASVVTLGEGMTPLLPTPRLGEAVGLSRLWVKDEGQNPTGTFKARGMAAAVSRAVELGATELATPTAGNAGSALAAYAARAGVIAHVAMPKDAPQPALWLAGRRRDRKGYDVEPPAEIHR